MREVNQNHPPSLGVFFATEMWERYGFYTVSSLLALYLALNFKWQDKDVYSLVSTFTALSYLSPFVGGWIADYLLGQKKAILMGSVLLFFSYLALFLVNSDTGLTTSLAAIAVGTGLIKPNISSLLGNEYPLGSQRRESGFTIFYMGITTGIILGTTLPSLLNSHFGWSVTFASAAIGMVIAFLIFLFGIYYYQIADYHPVKLQFANAIKAAVLTIFLWVLCYSLLQFPIFANSTISLVIVLSIGYLAHAIRQEPAKQAKKTLVIGLLCAISVVFWAFYFQMFLSLTLFISRAVAPKLWGIEFPPPYYVSIQSAGMIVLGYCITKNKRHIKQNGVRTGNKFFLSMVWMSLAYALITFASSTSRSEELLSPLYFIPAYLMISAAELLLSPVGLSAITWLASPKKVSTMMGIFFVSLGTGAFLSGKLANLTAIKENSLSILALKQHYSHSFMLLLLILLATTGVCFLLNGGIKFLLKEKPN